MRESDWSFGTLLTAVGYLVISAAILSGCGGASSMPPPPISVSFSGGTSQIIGQAQSLTITAVLTNDISGKGVSWTLTGPGALSKQNSTSVEFDAPASLASSTTATVTATAVADPSKSAVYTVNLAVIAVSISPASASVAVNTTQIFSATVTYDGSNAGVVWSVTQGGAPCSPACGSVVPLNTPSGASTTYTPPLTVPAHSAVTLTATSAADMTRLASASVTIAPPLPISVSISPDSASVEANTGVGFTATVFYDAANAGVSWSLTQGGSACSPGCGTLDVASTADGSPTTYTAPPTVPANPTVTLTATSLTDTAKSASAAITVIPPPIKISVGPTSVLLGVTASQQFKAIVQNDTAEKGVTWSLTQGGIPCSPECGTVAPPSTASVEATTYTAPSTVPANSLVVIVATSVADVSKSATAKITVTNGTVKIVPSAVDFGRIRVGASPRTQIRLTNTGTNALTITSIAITGTGAAVFSQTNTCDGTVAAGASCGITAVFAPVRAGSSPTADIVITDSSADSPQVVQLQGKGTASLASAIKAVLGASATIAVPSPTGPSGVGTRTMQLVDPSRRDPYVANTTRRELLVRFWYPASLAEGCRPAEYTSPKVWSYFSDLAGIPLPSVMTNSCLGAPVANGRHPIVVFTPGYTGTFTDYSFLFEDLASHGYIVASVDHTYEATVVEFPDGRFLESIPGSYLANIAGTDERELAFAVDVRLADLKIVVDQLEQLNATADSSFVDKLDTAHMAIAGHSLGGLTAFLDLEREPRFKAAVILDSVIPANLVNATERPVLILAAGHSDWSPSERHLWSELHGPRFLVNLRGAEHITPTDLVWLAKGAIRTGTMGPEKTIAAIRDYIVAFLDANLRGQPTESLLNGASSEFPDVELTTPLQSLPDIKK